MTKILLIGTIHYELNGTKRLERALQVEKPDILTVETIPQWRDYLAENWDQDMKIVLQAMKDKGFSQQAYSFFGDYLRSMSNFEYEVCRDYSNQTGVPLHLIEDPSIVRSLRQELLSRFQKLFDNIDPRILDGVSQESVIRGHDKLYAYIQNLYDGKIPAIDGEQQLIDPQRGKIIGKRDETEARNIEELAKNHDAKIVHVGGCLHNLTDSRGETLYSRLRSLNPSRTTLLSYDI